MTSMEIGPRLGYHDNVPTSTQEPRNKLSSQFHESKMNLIH